MLCWIDTHELPLGSIPPLVPALAISAAGLAPNAADDRTVINARTVTAAMMANARLTRRLLEKERGAGIVYWFLTKTNFPPDHAAV
jgi:hypothetical protein